jgi:two-component system, NtrC family, response regulator AtoC
MPDEMLAGLTILIVEDEVLLRKQIAARLQALGAEVSLADTLVAARKSISATNFDLALLDVNLPDGRGTDLLKERLFPPSTGVVVMTATGAVTGAVEAMRLGAVDYLVKPFDPAELPLVMERARRARQAARIEEHRRDESDFFFGEALAGLEAQLEKILVADRRVQGALAPILILGETGTGKTTIARWVHQRGPRAARPLVEVNCSALPEALAESELFGHERGAFTDARTARMGLFEAADGGTLFLDELPSLPLPLQAKVLSAIEDHKIRRVGGNKMISVDVRLIAATNRDLKDAVSQGRFREDLLHRLDLYRVNIPSLRERGGDILKLAELFASRLCQRHRLPAKKISPEGQRRLLSYHWPGNVRELAHEVEREIVFGESEELEFNQFASGLGIASDSKENESTSWLSKDFQFENFSLEAAINELIRLAMERSGGNVSAAARLLGVPRDFVRYRLGLKSRKPGGN